MIGDSEKRDIAKAIRDPDRWTLCVRYEDRWGFESERLVSPIRFLGNDAILALCLGREQPRRFAFDGIKAVRLVPAHQVLMPTPVRDSERRASRSASADSPS